MTLDPKKWPGAKVEMRKVADLIPQARNARTHSPEQVAQLAVSIKEWGWTTPLLTDENGIIIAGHGRVLAAKKLEIADIPVMVARGWTPAQKRAYVLADNKLALNAAWDEDLLRIEIGELNLGGFDLALAGFSGDELDGFFAEPQAPAAPPEAPDEFAAFDENIDTEHKCPKCGYAWSGKSS